MYFHGNKLNWFVTKDILVHKILLPRTSSVTSVFVSEEILCNRILWTSMSSVTISGKQQQSSSSNSRDANPDWKSPDRWWWKYGTEFPRSAQSRSEFWFLIKFVIMRFSYFFLDGYSFYNDESCIISLKLILIMTLNEASCEYKWTQNISASEKIHIFGLLCTAWNSTIWGHCTENYHQHLI